MKKILTFVLFVFSFETMAQVNTTYLQFDGDDYVYIEDSNDFEPSNFTIEGWFRFDDVTGLQSLIDKHYGNSFWDSYMMWLENGKLWGAITDNSGLGPFISYDFSPTPNTWYHLAYSFDDNLNVQKLFVNGQFVNSSTVNKSIAYDGEPLLLGASNDFQMVQFYFRGIMDEVRIWNRALSDVEMQNTYNIFLTGNEPGLIGYWKMNEGIGQETDDSSVFSNIGRLGSTIGADSNDPDWVTSPCPSTSLTLTSQAEVNAFPTNCNTINGDLIINGDDITDLSNLLSIQLVTGNVIIGDTIQGNIGNDELENLQGLNNIATIGGSLIICQNPNLVSLSGFSSLTDVGGDIRVKNCEELESFTLILLTNIGGNIILNGLPLLVDIGPFNFTIHNGDIVINGTGLTNLGGFSGLLGIGGDLFIQNNTNLTEINLQNLIDLGGCLHITNNVLLVDLSGLGNLQTIGGDIRIIDNDQIIDLNPFGNLSSVNGSLIISENDLLENLDSLSNLLEVIDSLVVTNNPSLSACCGLFPLLSAGNMPSVIIIENNLAGCDSVADILTNCVTPPITTWYFDGDNDGFGDLNNSTQSTTQPPGYVTNNDDCDDANPAINPAADEVCDGLDNNCDGDIDEGLFVNYYPDIDLDGYGDNAAAPNNSCFPISGLVTNNLDCDDANPAVNPLATEVCDGLDNNCDGDIDEGLFVNYYPDIDLDGYGDNSAAPDNSCFPISGLVANNDDCDDGNPDINPAATEVCGDGIDNDCDGIDTPCTPGCGTIVISTNGNDLNISGLDLQPISFVQIFDSNWSTLFQCFANCGGSLTQTYPNGTYFVFAKYFDSNYQQICEVLETVTLDGTITPPPPDDPCIDLDYVPTANLLTINNIDTNYFMEFQIFDLDWDSVYYCFKDCGATLSVPLPSNSYQVLVKYFNQNYSVVCERLVTVFVSDNLISNGPEFLFEAMKHEEHTEVVWIHSGGATTERYILEKSKDGQSFEEISDLPSERKNGPDFYQAYDLAPFDGDNFYRLKLLGDDGAIRYSETRMVHFPVLDSYTIFPNPANDFAKIDLSRHIGKSAQIQIYNNLGLLVKQFDLDNIYSKYYQMDLRELQEGHYIVWVMVEGHRATAKQLVVGKR